MKVAVVSDIHGNAAALRAVLQHDAVMQADRLACLGDIIGHLGSSGECVRLMQEQADYVVVGNHDTRLFSEREWVPEEDYEIKEYNESMNALSPEQLSWLKSLPAKLEKDGLVLAHCYPGGIDPTGVVGQNNGVHPKDFTTVGKDLDGEVLLLGHTHYQHAVRLDKFDGLSGAVVNPGSVGEVPGRADFAVVDTDSNTFDLFSINYRNT